MPFRLPVALLLSTVLLISCNDGGSTGAEPDPEPTTGTIEITTTTSGDDVDSDGFTFSVGSNSTDISSSSTDYLSNLQEGTYQAELSDISINCDPEESNPRDISVFAGDTTSVNYNISCLEQASNKIVFHSNRDGDYDIYMMNSDGTQTVQLTNDWADDKFPVFSRDGTKISFISGGSNGSSLKTMRIDGSKMRTLTSAPPLNGFGTRPFSSWLSDDGTIIFYRSGVRKVQADGSNDTRISNGAYPNWSPDANRIVYTIDSGTEIKTMDSDGGNQQTLAGEDVANSSPDSSYALRWSPDGNTIAGTHLIDGKGDIFLINSDGSQYRNLTDTTDINAEYPSWSPDGSRIVFQSDLYGDNELYIFELDNIGSWTNNPITNNPSDDGAPHWSPIE